MTERRAGWIELAPGAFTWRKPHSLPAPPYDDEKDGWRAGGDAICPACGLVYYDHPCDSEYTFLHVLCSGHRVKL